ncbi:60S ribosomal protein L18A [Anaeramoeba flamelloides]|uniref:60S ribosomal protein L18a n=1 Tax=Anaeramoeba flamelloides TaxID=1746091 RepID=A0ABQ8XQ74_9EUKA|nr:60S ribosomal protein L18A [Anaeramoeba flamelloides]
MRYYQVVGRAIPTKKAPNPQIYRMKLFAPNSVVAKARFWYFTKRLVKIKKVKGEILSVDEIFEKDPETVKNYGIWLRYNSRSGKHNMYKEYRDVTLTGAIQQMYNEMAGNHKARFQSIQIIKTKVLEDKECKRPQTLQFHDPNLKFPLIHRATKKNKERRPTFTKKKPFI